MRLPPIMTAAAMSIIIVKQYLVSSVAQTEQAAFDHRHNRPENSRAPAEQDRAQKAQARAAQPPTRSKFVSEFALRINPAQAALAHKAYEVDPLVCPYLAGCSP